MNAGQEALLNGYEQAYKALMSYYTANQSKKIIDGWNIFWLLLEVIAVINLVSHIDDIGFMSIAFVAFPLLFFILHTKNCIQSNKRIKDNLSALQGNYDRYKNEVEQVSKNIKELNADAIKAEMHKIYNRKDNDVRTDVMRRTVGYVYKVQKEHDEYQKFGDSPTRPVKCHRCYELFEIPKSIIKGENIASYETTESVKCPNCKWPRVYLYKPEYADQQRQEQWNKYNKCPKCRSTQVHAGEKGFSTGKALVGGAVAGGIGLLAGMHGSKKLKITCLSCGHSWIPDK